ncbi:MAG: BspA family leucine-rich repeat surface protein, partial [Spirochaetota bacterium]
MAGMFQGAASFNNGKAPGNSSLSASIDRQTVGGTKKAFGDWNTSKVQDMSGMFAGATSFNQDLSGWRFSKVEKTTAMFRGATAFTAALPTLKPETAPRLRDTSFMFEGAAKFKQSLSSWDLPKGTNIEGMFSGSKVTELPQVGEATVEPLGRPGAPKVTEEKLNAEKLNAVELTWQPVSDATAYIVYYSQEAGFTVGAKGVLAQKVAAGTSTSVGGLLPYKTYYFRLVATSPKHWASAPSPAAPSLTCAPAATGAEDLSKVQVAAWLGETEAVIQVPALRACSSLVLGKGSKQTRRLLMPGRANTITTAALNQDSSEKKLTLHKGSATKYLTLAAVEAYSENLKGFFMASFKNNLYVLGGEVSDTRKDKIYRSADGVVWDTVTPQGTSFTARNGAAAAVFQDHLYVLGGYGSSSLNDVYKTA